MVKKISVFSILLVSLLLSISPLIVAFHTSSESSGYSSGSSWQDTSWHSWSSWHNKCWPSYEMCDGKDNDCDGNIDENNGNCDDDELCTSGRCIPEDDEYDAIRCRNDIDCGTDKFLGDKFCQSGDVYQNFKVFSCINPGKKSSYCETQVDPIVVKDCKSTEKCSQGNCVPREDDIVRCNKNSDCGTNGFFGSKFCQNGDVYQNFKRFECNNPGTVMSSCSSDTNPKLVEDCPAGCSDGKCKKKEDFVLIKETTARFEGNQGPWEHVSPSGDAQSPTLALSSLKSGQKIKVDDVRGTFSFRIYNGKDYFPFDCGNGFATFTNDNKNFISRSSLSAFNTGLLVPSGATRLYVHILEQQNSRQYFDNSGNRDRRSPCEVDFSLYEKKII